MALTGLWHVNATQNANSGAWVVLTGARVAVPGDNPTDRPYLRTMSDIDSVIVTIATSQSGTISRRQLLDAGVGVDAVRSELERGRLLASHRGVYLLAGAPLCERQALWAAHLATGHSSVVSHGSAGILHKLHAVQPCPPTLTIPHGRSIRRRSGLVIHRSRHLDDADVMFDNGLPVTSPTRTIVDLAGECSRVRLAAMLEEAHFGRVTSYSRVGETLLRVGGAGRAGVCLLCSILDDQAGGENLARSVLERLLGELLRRAGIEQFSRQHPLPSLGAIEGMVDAYVDDGAMVTEVDGRRWHARQADMKRDRERDFAAMQMGVITVRFLHEHLTSDMEGCAEGLRRVVANRRADGHRGHR